MRRRVYLDWNATAPLRDEARQAMCAAMDLLGNPSSVHAEGRAAKALLERARGQVAAFVGAAPEEVVFTSGATEAARVLAGCGAVEETAHDALWAQRARAGASAIYAMGLANSETGILTELQDAEARRVFLDVTQAVGRVPFSFAWSGAEMACLSAHKIGGPKGVGALLVRKGTDFEGIQPGGGQELGRRSGTENLIGIAGFGAACVAAGRDLDAGLWDRVEKLRNILETTLASRAKETIFVGQDRPRLPNTSCFVTPGWKGETQVMQMDLEGYAVSSGSACSSGKVKAPRVLRGMGLTDAAAESALRVSFGPETTEGDLMGFAEAWLKQERKFRQRAA